MILYPLANEMLTMLIVIYVVLKMYVPLPSTHFHRNVVLLNYIFSLAHNYVSSKLSSIRQIITLVHLLHIF